MLLEPLTKLFRLFADRVSLPLGERSRWFSKEHLGLAILESAEERRDTERTNTTFLRVLLLCFSNKAGDVLDAWRVFVLEAETLALKSGFVYQHSCVRLQSRKCDCKMLINLLDFANRAHVL
jgi:hypothetical protein